MATKLYIPPPPSKGVRRPRLIERLNEGAQRKLTLISAPAGFGKSTLVSEWIATRKQKYQPDLCAAWLSLDESDSKLDRFLSYLIAALQMVVPNIGETALEALQSSQSVPLEPILTALLNDIIRVSSDFFLILDDYHLIDTRQPDASNPADTSHTVDSALTFLLDHQPPHMHLIITTREDPHLPLARLRARNQLTELHASDLRFNAYEANQFLQGMRLNLSEVDILALEDRTEGWIAGLQLAALTLQGALSTQGSHFEESHQGITDFIQTFAGDHRYIMDYLVEEVLQRQTQPIRDFLLQTSILDRLSGPLCDAVTVQGGSSQRLEALQRGNFFVISLDNNRQWYRYHHLFAEALSAYLAIEQADQVAVLHRRASEWHEQNGSPASAIHHALIGADFERAANLIERAAISMRRSRQEATLLGWLKALPEALVQERPVLCDIYAGTLLQKGEIEGVEKWLQAAERWLDSVDIIPTKNNQPDFLPNGMIVMNAEEFHRLPAAVAAHRAGQALMLGNVAATIQYAQRALDLVQEDDHLGNGAAAGLLGLASWALGDLETSQRWYAESIARLLKAGHTSDAIGLLISLADIQMAQGHPTAALHTFERGLKLTMKQSKPALRGAADMLVGISEIYCVRGDFQSAEQYLLKSKELGELNELVQNPYRWRVVKARIEAAQGDPDSALILLDEAERLYMSDFSPNVHPIAAVRARLWAAQGRLDEALAWVQSQSLPVTDDLSYLREYEHITLARVLLAQFQRRHTEQSLRDAEKLLSRLQIAAEEGGRTGSVIEILILQALSQQAQLQNNRGDPQTALVLLERALMLAEPEGYIRIFVDEGQPMAQLLGAAARHATQPKLQTFISKLLAAYPEEQLRSDIHAALPASETQKAPHKPVNNTLVEPLSERERDVLRLFKTELSGPEIAQELVIAISTLRSHTKSIYSKLNVNSRRAAVNRAIELDLI